MARDTDVTKNHDYIYHDPQLKFKGDEQRPCVLSSTAAHTGYGTRESGE